MNAIRTTSMGLAACFVILAGTAHADCGRPTPRQAVTALSASHPLVAQAQPQEALSARPEDDGRQNVVGLWLTTSTIEGGQVQAFESFTSDGLEFLNDNGSPIEGNVCLGVWGNGAKGSVTVNHPAWNYDPAGNLIGTVVIKEQITLDPGGKTFHGTISVDIYDLTGNSLGHVAGTYTGKRITV